VVNNFELSINNYFSALPYTPTKIQVRILEIILKTYERKIYSLIEAANGVGKTTCLATAAAILARRNVSSTIFCLTYKQISRIINELKQIDSSLKTTIVGSRNALCCSDNSVSARTICRIKSLRYACPYGKPRADYSLWLADVDDIVQNSRREGICAYEAAWESVGNAQIVLATQAYLLYENSWRKLSRFVNNSFILVDECHNLIHGGVNVFSFPLSFKSSNCKRISQILSSRSRWSKRKLVEKLGDEESFMWSMYEEIKYQLGLNNNYLTWQITNEYNLVRLLWEANYDRLFISQNRCEGYLGYPEDSLNKRLNSFSGGVFVSATPGSIETYKRIVYDKPLYVEKIPSPYTREQLKIYIVDDFTTRFTERTTQNYLKLSKWIVGLLDKTRSLGVFFPSYDYLNKMVVTITEQYGYVSLILESESLMYLTYHGNRAVFSVQGGREGEGTEIPGGLDLVVVVGLALPFPKSLLAVREKMYRGLGLRDPSEPAYLSWATQKAVQAVGRVIRGPNDKGIGILIDKRFKSPKVLRSFPSWFKNYIVGSMSFGSLLSYLEV
jgi:DNA excision repair protein ERCC-2